MENLYFKMIGQKTSDGKMILVAVIDEKFMGNVPNIFEVQAIKIAPTIYSGTYPTIKINTQTIKNRDDLKGLGISGILTEEKWYNISNKEKNPYGILLNNN